MARVFIDGFESGGTDLWDTVSSSVVVSSSGLDMDGDYCLNSPTYAYVQKDVSVDDEMYFAFLYRQIGGSGTRDMLAVYYNTTRLCRISYAATGIHFYVGAVDTVTGTETLADNTTYLIEVRFKIADAGGRCVVKVDGAIDIDYTGDTKTGADTQFNKVRLGNSGDYTGAYFDNLIMDDAAWVGNTRIQKILPTGAGNTTGWTPSAGANWTCVDERPASDTDYVSVNTNDAVDTYVVADMAGFISTVKCVQVQSRTESDGSPTPTNLKLVVRSGATNYLSGDNAVPADPAGLCYLWETNPADSAAWEEADVNAMEIGIKSAA